MKTKNESIKLRVTKEQKEKLKYLSKQNNESMSVYILRKSMEEKITSYIYISYLGLNKTERMIYHEQL